MSLAFFKTNFDTPQQWQQDRFTGIAQTLPKTPERCRRSERQQRNDQENRKRLQLGRDIHPLTKQSEQAGLVLRTGLYARRALTIKLKTVLAGARNKILRGFEAFLAPDFCSTLCLQLMVLAKWRFT